MLPGVVDMYLRKRGLLTMETCFLHKQAPLWRDSEALLTTISTEYIACLCLF